uniref:Hepatic sodium/bile acid cotransporter n=1 Tax=Mola mola TaxID=94237 RepID=A0A3Q3VJI9_MOLML
MPSPLCPLLEANDSSSFNTTSVSGPIMSAALNKTINIVLMVALTITMVSLGCTMEPSKIKRHIMKPKGVAIAALCQYGVMPLTAFCLAKAFRLSDIRAVVVLICGCCPGGSLSNILALALQGDMNLSIVMTCCSTVLALGMMPLLLYLYCQGFPNLHGFVPFVDIIISLAMILIPCGAGIIFNYYRPQYAQIFKKVSISLSVLTITIVVIGIISIVGIGGSILTVLAPPLMVTGALMPFTGYTFGYIISTLFRLTHPERRTVAMETGCQNVQLCSTILKVAFPPEMIGPLFLFPLTFGALQLIEALVLIVLFRCHQRFALKHKGERDASF